ncbi:MAG: rRNA methyltransferase, partial [Alphaproteobacteria bacterium]|nr:rRNA methyltransferase [Alphaproteobacteria bacterium]
LVLSDMAPNTTGHAKTDHMRIMALAEMAFDWASHHLKTGGHFVCKLFQGGESGDFHKTLQKHFAKVNYAKPSASRAGSSEVYLVATGFKGI